MPDRKYTCVCSKVCTSLAGLTLHQKSCNDAVEAKTSGRPTMVSEGDEGREFDSDVQSIVELVAEMSVDADRCLTESNKSAGKRARKALNEIKKKITPLRKRILEVMKQ